MSRALCKSHDMNIKKNKDGQLIFEVELTNGDIHLGGSDFDNMMIDYCIKEFCRRTEFDENEVRKDKRACHRLKIKCENAKKRNPAKSWKSSIFEWLGWQDSNLRMSESKSDALPLGDSPIYKIIWGGYWGSNPAPPVPQTGALTR